MATRRDGATLRRAGMPLRCAVQREDRCGCITLRDFDGCTITIEIVAQFQLRSITFHCSDVAASAMFGEIPSAAVSAWWAICAGRLAVLPAAFERPASLPDPLYTFYVPAGHVPPNGRHPRSGRPWTAYGEPLCACVAIARVCVPSGPILRWACGNKFTSITHETHSHLKVQAKLHSPFSFISA